jgi:hypothetical protein
VALPNLIHSSHVSFFIRSCCARATINARNRSKHKEKNKGKGNQKKTRSGREVDEEDDTREKGGSINRGGGRG